MGDLSIRPGRENDILSSVSARRVRIGFFYYRGAYPEKIDGMHNWQTFFNNLQLHPAAPEKSWAASRESTVLTGGNCSESAAAVDKPANIC